VNGHPLDRVPRAPRTCVWELTRRCNLRCIHCENECGDGSARELSMERIREVARELAALGCHDIDVTGGEPLLHPRWDEICRDLAGLGLRTALITNGTLLDQEHLDRAIDAGVGIVAISLDGLQATHDGIRQRPGPGPSPWQEAVAAIARAAPRIESRPWSSPRSTGATSPSCRPCATIWPAWGCGAGRFSSSFPWVERSSRTSLWSSPRRIWKP
jgi:pyruvate-formate lyase-activating enzyme